MIKRNTQQRRHAIISLLNEQGKVSVEDLSQRFATSEVTIRKDLAELERSGVLLRRYGGAISLPSEILAEEVPAKVSQRKLAIAQAAIQHIRDHNRIIIDSGSTTGAMIPLLAAKRGLVVMTNSLTVAQALRELENEPTLLMTGGPGIRIPKLSKGRWQNRYYAPMILISCLSVRMGLIRRVALPPLMNWLVYHG